MFSQKRTNTRNGQPRTVTSRRVVRKSGVWVVQSEKKDSRFAGMSEDLEKLQPVRIPGYKVRGQASFIYRLLASYPKKQIFGVSQ